MQSIEPMVSIIIPNFNCEKFIGLTIDSVISQSFQNWELIVVDDCSTDKSRDVIQKYVDADTRVRLLVMEKNSGGPAGPRNLGIEKANGSLIAFLDSDDIWHPKKLEYQLKFMNENHVNFTSTMRLVFSNDHEVQHSEIGFSKKTNKISYHSLLKKNMIVTSSVIVQRDLIGETRFNTSKSYVAIEDYDFFLDLLKKGSEIDILKMPLVHYRISTQNISKNKMKMAKKVRGMLIDRKGEILGHYYFIWYSLLSLLYLIKKR